MTKIMIIGCPGSGKSTLATQLGSHKNLPVYHLDSFFWGPGWKPIERNKFIEKQKDIMKKPAWIIDGNYGATMNTRLKYVDTIIFLHYSTTRCLYRIIKRRIQYHGQTRPDMGEDCKEKIDWEFVHYVLKFNKVQSPTILEKLDSVKEKQIYIFKNPKQLRHFFHQIKDISID
ncbi:MULTISPECIES: DNA topology modulation protein [unclassified Oceanobacillus]|uniref:DNA topology modulation protein n=1 Tax=unclassified Oceanobacillus TaxID=2630292 RepID=UPI001BE4FFF9|nr:MULTISPECIES: DNA topology modulation protein [unclassified Oceanobacillus]MBT2599207.1 DNA topology modulation protein [Oceanobacillus sp. ISL-74]MBT2652125.1 DNA topology modulation protein [Oceanobacillus sp. ISL-73]